MKQLLFGAMVVLILANTANAEICITGQANKMLEGKISYANITILSLPELDETNTANCDLMIFNYFDEMPQQDQLDIYEYTANNYVFWLGNPPFVPCIEQKAESINVSGMIVLNKYCNIIENITNLEIKITNPMGIQEIGAVYADGKKYPIIFQSNGQNLIYFAYNAVETPDVLNCLIKYAANISGEKVSGNEEYLKISKTNNNILALVVVLLILFAGGAIVWKS